MQLTTTVILKIQAFNLIVKDLIQQTTSALENSSLLSNCMNLTSTEECIGIVHFLQATRVPGRHERLMRMQFSQQHVCYADHLLLKSDHSILHQIGVNIESAL